MEQTNEPTDAIRAFIGRGRAKKAAHEGNLQEGVFYAGAGASMVEDVISVRELFDQILAEYKEAVGRATGMMALDPFGRTLQVDQSGLPPTYHRVLDCDASCPPLARFRMLHHQNGTPEVTEYADLLGRKIETRSTAFDGVTSIVDAVGFDARGHTVHTSEPSDQPGGLYFMELKEFDALDRPHRKLVDKTGYTDANGLPHESFEIEYFPDGLTTSITLDGQLTASRTYNALGQVIETVDTAGGTTTYRYDGRGHLILIRDPAGNDTRMTFDDLGHRIAIKDPDRGDWAFKSNGAGELIEQTDANGDVVTFGHDDLGRVIDRSLNGQLESRWTFDLTAKGTLDQETKLDVHTGQPIFTRTFGYDGDLREVLRVESFEGRAYQTRQIYDCQGHLWGIEYPNGEAVEMHYSDEGYLVRETNPLALPPDDLYREVTAMNPRGQIEAETFGNHLIGRYDYFASTGQVRHLLVCQESDPSCSSPLQDLEYGYVDPFANLTHRTKTFHGAVPGVSLTSVREDYDYDNLQRLAKATRTWTGSGAPAPVSVDYQYDALGNIERKADYAIDYDYGAQGRANPHLAGPHAVTQIDKIGAGVVDDFLYDGNGNMITGDGRSIAYTVFNKPEMISEGAVTTHFFYGPNHARYHQDVGTKTTRYAGGGLFEEIEDAAGTEQKAFVGANVVITTGPNGREVHWLHLDQLGSVETVTDADGEVVEAHGYDAFGAPRNSTWEDNGRMLHSGEFASETTTHGFTKHEHLDAHGLIHMNGRAYDPGLGRFLSVDPFIADITNAQQLNAYSYVLNNPLSNVDPTGYMPNPRESISTASLATSPSNALVSYGPGSKEIGDKGGPSNGANLALDLATRQKDPNAIRPELDTCREDHVDPAKAAEDEKNQDRIGPRKWQYNQNAYHLSEKAAPSRLVQTSHGEEWVNEAQYELAKEINKATGDNIETFMKTGLVVLLACAPEPPMAAQGDLSPPPDPPPPDPPPPVSVGRGGDSVGRTFVTTPNGKTVSIPEGWVGRSADNGNGIVYQRSGATANADMIRVMDPTPRYPSGYVRYYNQHGQPLDVFGKPGSRATTHIPLDYAGPIPGWPK